MVLSITNGSSSKTLISGYVSRDLDLYGIEPGEDSPQLFFMDFSLRLGLSNLNNFSTTVVVANGGDTLTADLNNANNDIMRVDSDHIEITVSDSSQLDSRYDMWDWGFEGYGVFLSL